MNSCILMAEIIQQPELRYTSDNQTPIAEMLVQFPALRAEDAPATLKVVGWGNLAQEIQERYHQGDRVVIEGRLSMNTIDRPEGFKEKRAELTAQRIHRLGAETELTITPASATPAGGTTSATRKPPAAAPGRTADPSPAATSRPAPQSAPQPPTYTAPANDDFDDIPF